MAVLLEDEFLRSLGIKNGFMPRRSATKDGLSEDAKANQNLPMAEGKPVPLEVLNLSPEELEKLLKEQHSQENPYVYLMPGGRHTVAVYPNETNETPNAIDKYDMWLTARPSRS